MLSALSLSVSVSLLIRLGATRPAGGSRAGRGRPGSRTERESVPARRPSGAGQREPPERQRRRRRRRQQHPPRSEPALGVAAAGRHECYYSERRCRSIALSQWQRATGLILRAVRGVHLSPAAFPRPPPPPPGPTAATVRARVGASSERDAPRAAPRPPRARDATATAGGRQSDPRLRSGRLLEGQDFKTFHSGYPTYRI
ncbi:translation initiation factor IF-2 [Phoca vitulina]|uniref:translation initiation factor IF-2 n=1 Tax=Phoca vitulina TaxID=9720 RepID=UPI00139660AF|nr:translation initiation factor IF-2 [Phoca vitulina]